MKFLFISGSHKSGTSWMASMIGAHPHIRIPKQEMWLFGSKSSIADLTEKMLNEWLDLPTVSSLFNKEKKRKNVINSAVRGAIRGVLTQAVGDMTNVNVIGDKTPLFYALQAKKIHSVYPDAYFVHIVRDPRDVIVSHHFHAYRLNEWNFFRDADRAKAVAQRIRSGEDVGVDLLEFETVQRLCSDWISTQSKATEARSLFKDRYYGCRYEDLLEECDIKIAEVFNTLQEPLPQSKVDEIVAQCSFSVMSKGRASGESDAASFFRKGIAGDWVNYFDQDALKYISENCQDMGSAFGYDLGLK